MRQHIQRSVELRASVIDVWAAITASDRLGDWLGGVTDLEPIVDAEFTFVDESGARFGVVLEVVDQGRLKFWWASSDAEEGSVVTIDLEPVDEMVRVAVSETPARLLDRTTGFVDADEGHAGNVIASQSAPVGFQPPTLSRAT